ncbi:MAG: hypothetical protein AAF616_03370 [Bacteroidota bacterium]
MRLPSITKKWTFFFYVLDANRDGILEADDIEEIVKRVINIRTGNFSPGEIHHLRYQTLKSFDRLLIEATNGKSRKIRLAEWVHIIEKYNVSERKPYFIRWFAASAMKFLFDLCDHNQDGEIDFDEFGTLYKILGLSRKETLHAFKYLDANRDCVLSKFEMYNAIKEFFSASNATINNYMFGQYEAISEEYYQQIFDE